MTPDQKHAVEQIMIRYEEIRQSCLNYGGYHPSEPFPCQKAIGNYALKLQPIGMRALELLDDVFVTLRASIAEPQPSTSDEELAREAVADILEISGMQADFVNKATQRIIKAFTSIREQARNEALEEAATILDTMVVNINAVTNEKSGRLMPAPKNMGKDAVRGTYADEIRALKTKATP